jgi:hypothetical protein
VQPSLLCMEGGGERSICYLMVSFPAGA